MSSPHTQTYSEQDSAYLRKTFEKALSWEEIANTSKVQRTFLIRAITKLIDKHGIANITPELIRERYLIITEYVIPDHLEGFLKRDNQETQNEK